MCSCTKKCSENVKAPMKVIPKEIPLTLPTLTTSLRKVSGCPWGKL
jgi:hypothetical protein